MKKQVFNKKGFTLIELIVVIAVIAILVLLGIPKMQSYKERARLTNIKNNIKVLEGAAERYYIDNIKWPKDTKKTYSKEQIEKYAKEILHLKGEQVVLESGDYYLIDYNEIRSYSQKPRDGYLYILQNPVGNVYYLDNLTDEGKEEFKDYLEDDNDDGTGGGGGETEPTEPRRFNNIVIDSTGETYHNILTRATDGGYLVGGQYDGQYYSYPFFAKYDIDGNLQWKVQTDQRWIYDVIDTKDGGYGVLLSYGGDSYIQKYNEQRQKSWKTDYEKPNGTSLRKMIELDDGNFVLAGSLNRKDFGDGSTLDEEPATVTFDSNGTLIKENRMYREDKHDYIFEIEKTSDGGYITAGEVLVLIPNVKYKGLGELIKFSKTGVIEWRKQFGGTGIDTFHSVTQTQDGGYIAVGKVSSTDAGLTVKGESDALIVRYDSSGTKLWAKSFGGTKEDVYDDVVELQDGSIIAVGNSLSTNTGEFTNKGGADAIIVKYDSSGAQQWVKTIGTSGTDDLKEIVAVEDGGFAVVGKTNTKNAVFMKCDKDGVCE